MPEIQKIQGSHGFHHQDLLDQQLLDLDTRLRREMASPRLRSSIAPLQKGLGAHIVNDLLKPKFINLVDYDKEHFIMGGLPRFYTHQILSIQEFVELQILMRMNRSIRFGVAHCA